MRISLCRTSNDMAGELDRRVRAGGRATPGIFRTESGLAGHAIWKQPKIRVTSRVAAARMFHETITQLGGRTATLEAGQPIASIAGVVDVNQGY